MRIPETYKCDHPGCEAVKGETNHWYAVYTDENRTSIITWAYFMEKANPLGYSHFCGADHALQAVSRWLSERV